MSVEFVLVPVPLSGCPESDSNTLAERLQICCYDEPLLRRTYTLRFEDTEGAPLGKSWKGALEYVFDSVSQIKVLSKAILTAFQGREVELHVQCGKKKISIRTKNVQLADVEPMLKECLGFLE